MGIEADLYRKKLSSEEAYRFKKRCWTCKYYILNKNGTSSCGQYGRLITDVTDRDCAIDGSQRR